MTNEELVSLRARVDRATKLRETVDTIDQCLVTLNDDQADGIKTTRVLVPYGQKFMPLDLDEPLAAWFERELRVRRTRALEELGKL